MVVEIKSWLKENHTLVVFLVAQVVALGAAGVTVVAYSVKLETRVMILETRGATYSVERLNQIDQRLTVIEQRQQRNEAQIERLVTEALKDKRP